ncbi:MAG: tetraacyldisaccharide 4'-kinase [Candidatus Rokuibacteriota bacterium]
MSPVRRGLASWWQRGAAGAGAQRALGAASGGYRGLLTTREWLYARGVLRSRALPCPVVSVGNLTVGGTGKTPAVEMAVRTLIDLGHTPAVVSRGYGRRSTGIQIVADAASIRLDAEEAGDEPFLLARRLPGVPVVVGSNRYEAGRTAVARFGVTAIVLDDGLQHRTLVKNLEIVMARATEPWGNGRLLPRGPLREPVSGLARAHLVVVTGAATPGAAPEVVAAVARYAPGVPVLTARHAPTGCWEAGTMRAVAIDHLARARLLGFAGIAAPAGFRRTLEETGAGVVELVPFPDHHWYTRDDLARLERRGAELGVDALVTTEKDWVRLRRLPPPTRPLYVLSIRLVLTTAETEWLEAFRTRCPTP